MGCPVKKVIKTGGGAALLRDTEKIGEILKSVRKATHLPLTVKIRAGWRRWEINCLDVARIAEDCGADAVILHPRTADQGFSGFAEWKLIGDVKKHVKIPVIGNGDIRTVADAMRMLCRTGCDGIMIGRGCLGNPWIFKDIVSCHRGCSHVSAPTPGEREKVIRAHLAMVLGVMGEPAGVRYFRKHLLWYTKGLHGGSRFRQCAGTVTDGEALLETLHAFLCSVGRETPAE
jgi:tRNA-dihydrouridine synthase B